MTNTPQKTNDDGSSTTLISVKLPSDLISLIDQWLVEAKAQRPGIHVTRSDAVRDLLYRVKATPRS